MFPPPSVGYRQFHTHYTHSASPAISLLNQLSPARRDEILGPSRMITPRTGIDCFSRASLSTLLLLHCASAEISAPVNGDTASSFPSTSTSASTQSNQFMPATDVKMLLDRVEKEAERNPDVDWDAIIQQNHNLSYPLFLYKFTETGWRSIEGAVAVGRELGIDSDEKKIRLGIVNASRRSYFTKLSKNDTNGNVDDAKTFVGVCGPYKTI